MTTKHKSQIRLSQLTGSVYDYRPTSFAQLGNSNAFLTGSLSGSFVYLAQALSNIHGNLEYGNQAIGTISHDSRDVLIETTTSGKLDFNSAAGVELDAVGAIAIESSTSTISIGADNIAQNIFIGSDGTRTIQIGAGDGTSTSTINSRGGTLLLDGTGQTVDINSAVLDVDASGKINIATSVAAADALTIDVSANGGADITVGNAADDANAVLDLIVMKEGVFEFKGTGANDGLDVKLGGTAGSTNFRVLDSSGNAELTVADNGNVTIAGDLTVNGTTTTVDTDNLLVKDGIIVLNRDQTSKRDAGIVFRHNANEGKVFGYDINAGDADGMFKIGQTVTANVIDGTATSLTYSDDGELSLGALYLSSSVSVENKLFLDDLGGVNNRTLSLSGSHAVGLYAKADDINLTAGAQNKKVVFHHDDGGSISFNSFDAGAGAGVQPRTEYGQISHSAGMLGFHIKGLNDQPISLETSGLDVPTSAVLSQRGHKFEFVNSEAAVGGDAKVYGHVTGSAAGLILSGGDALQGADILFHISQPGEAFPNNPLEIFRVDASQKSLLIAGNNPLQFNSQNMFIKKGGGSNNQLQIQNDTDYIEIIAKTGTKIQDVDNANAGFLLEHGTANVPTLNFNKGGDALQVGAAGKGIRFEGTSTNKMQVAHSDGVWDQIATITDVNSAAGTEMRPVAKSLTLGQSLAEEAVLSTLTGFTVFDLSTITNVDEEKKIDVYVNGQLLLSGNNGSGLPNQDYCLYFDTFNRAQADIKFAFVLEEFDTVQVLCR